MNMCSHTTIEAGRSQHSAVRSAKGRVLSSIREKAHMKYLTDKKTKQMVSRQVLWQAKSLRELKNCDDNLGQRESIYVKAHQCRFSGPNP